MFAFYSSTNTLRRVFTGSTGPTITATLTPAMSRLYEGQAIEDTTDYGTMVSLGNFSSPWGTIDSAVVTAIGAASVSTALTENDVVGFSVLVTDSATNQETFNSGTITVEYKINQSVTSGNELEIDINDLVPDAEVLTIVVSGSDYDGTYNPTAGDLRGLYNFTGTVGISYTGLEADLTTGSVLTAEDGLWSSPTTGFGLSRRWMRDAVAISGETGTTYTLTADDLDKAITLEVTGSDDGGSPVIVTSAAVNVPAASGSLSYAYIKTFENGAPTSADVTDSFVFGTAEADRELVILVGTGTNNGGTLLAPTLNGVAMTEIFNIFAGTDGRRIAGYRGAVPSATTYNFLATFPDSKRGYSFVAWEVTGASTYSVVTDIDNTGLDLNLDTNVLVDDVVLGITMMTDIGTTGDVTWTGLTERAVLADYYAPTPPRTASWADLTITAAETPRTIQSNFTGDFSNWNLGAALRIRG